MICAKCQEMIPEGEEMNHMGQVLCEDCYVEAVEPPRTCDVAAVYSAKLARKMAGQTGTDGLTQVQKEIYEYIKEKGKATPEEVAKKFDLSAGEIQRQFTTLRHCELVKGTRINGVIYMLIMDGGPGSVEV